MKLPLINKESVRRKSVSRFGGLDRRGSAAEDSFSELYNMDLSVYPALSTRAKRTEVNFSETDIFGMTSLDVKVGSDIVCDAFILDTQNNLKAYYDDGDGFSGHIAMHTASFLTQGKKQMVASGTRLYFFPDKKVVNLVTLTDKQELGYKRVVPLGVNDNFFYELVIEKSDLDGTINTSGAFAAVSCNIYKLKNGAKGDYYDKLGYTTAISEGDTIEISGLSKDTLNGYYNIKHIPANRRSIVISCPENLTQSTGSFVIDRSVPDMDYVVAAKNRLWGCRYGMVGGAAVNEIYACALGDAKNWHKFEGTSTDSWTLSVNTPGAFTGAACLNGYPVFFKENAVIKIYGDYPAEFMAVETQQLGVEKGSGGSIAAVGDCLYYKSADGIVRYDGSVPEIVDACLGDGNFSKAIAGSLGKRYYVSMADSSGCRQLYVYDTERKLWHVENDPGIEAFCRRGNGLYMLCRSGSTCKVYGISGDTSVGSRETGGVEWSFETGDILRETPEHKYISRIYLRLSPGSDCTFCARLSCDGEKHRTVSAHGGSGDGSVTVSLRPSRCASFRLRVQGRGSCTLHGITYEYSDASTVSPKGI